MSYLPQQYYYNYPSESYQPQFWAAIVGGVIDIVIMIALAAWAFSLVKKAFRGEEVELR